MLSSHYWKCSSYKHIHYCPGTLCRTPTIFLLSHHISSCQPEMLHMLRNLNKVSLHVSDLSYFLLSYVLLILIVLFCLFPGFVSFLFLPSLLLYQSPSHLDIKVLTFRFLCASFSFSGEGLARSKPQDFLLLFYLVSSLVSVFCVLFYSILYFTYAYLWLTLTCFGWILNYVGYLKSPNILAQVHVLVAPET